MEKQIVIIGERRFEITDPCSRFELDMDDGGLILRCGRFTIGVEEVTFKGHTESRHRQGEIQYFVRRNRIETET